MSERQGEYMIPTRVYVTPERRAKLEQIVRERGMDVADVISQIVADYLDTLPPVQPVPAPDHPAELRWRRAELARLRLLLAREGQHAPAWLRTQIADLEAEVQRLEG